MSKDNFKPKYADGVIVGSAFVKLILENQDKELALSKVEKLA